MGGVGEETRPRFKTEEGRRRYLAAYEAALKNWPVPYEALDVPTRLGPTHVIASGPADAPPLLLLPSLAATGLVWRANALALSRTWRTYAVDVIGQPGKSLAHRSIGDAREYVGWMDDLMDQLGAAKASIVGCSFGGFLAAQQALETPDRVDRVVLIGPPGVFTAMSWTLALTMRTARLRRRIRKLLGRRGAPVAEVLHAGAAPVHPEDDAWRRLMALTMSEQPALSVTHTRVFSKAELRRIAAPMLLLIGEYERLYEPRQALRRARQLKPDVVAEMVAGADHIAAMAQPEWVNARIASFLEAGGPAR